MSNNSIPTKREHLAYKTAQAEIAELETDAANTKAILYKKIEALSMGLVENDKIWSAELDKTRNKIAELENRCIEFTMTWPADLAEANHRANRHLASKVELTQEVEKLKAELADAKDYGLQWRDERDNLCLSVNDLNSENAALKAKSKKLVNLLKWEIRFTVDRGALGIIEDIQCAVAEYEQELK